jgi:cytochrome bd ubiquinol oxidase subunit I
MSALDLARLQFGITILFHFLFVPLSIGTAFYVAVCQTLHYRTGKDIYGRQVSFWGKVMLVSFAVGVVTGIIQEFQFGMNWSTYSRFVGDVFGAPLAMEGLVAFFVESTFVGLWLFGKGRLSPRVHLATIWCVSIATVASAYFIIVANSWMQHPAGSDIDPRTGRAHLTSVWDLLSNNTAIWSFLHVIFAALITGTVIALAVSASHLRRGHEVGVFTAAVRIALPILAAAVLCVFLAGDQLGELLVKQQPMKMAAAEALLETEQPAAFSVFATGPLTCTPETKNRELKIPHLLSILATHSWDGKVIGVHQAQQQEIARHGPGNYTPCVPVIYWSFRVMVYGYGLLVLLVLGGGYLLWRRRLPDSPRYLRFAAWAWPLPFLINSAGWVMTEMGRQPWIVQGLLKTNGAQSPTVSTTEVWLTLLGYTAVYAVLGVIAFWIIRRETKEGLAHEPPPPREGEPDLSLAY